MESQEQDGFFSFLGKLAIGFLGLVASFLGKIFSFLFGIKDAHATPEAGEAATHNCPREVPQPTVPNRTVTPPAALPDTPPRTVAPPPVAPPPESVVRNPSPTIVLDLGHGVVAHGGHEHRHVGASHGGVHESEVVAGIGEKVKSLLEAKGVKVVLSRGDDIPHDNRAQLNSRPKAADREKADMFVSIHANAAESAPGVANTAMKGSEVYAHRDDGGESKRLAAILAQSMNGKSLTAGFAVLDEKVHGQRPAVLVETDYLTNPEARAKLASESGQMEIARKIASGITQYMNTDPAMAAYANIPAAPGAGKVRSS